MDDRIGQQFGNYRILRLLGEGGFARVYLGKHLHLRSLAAIKVLHTKLVTRERDAFIREAQTIAELDHPAIIRVLESGFDQESPYVVMNYAPGGTLRQRHPRGSRLPLEQIITYVVQVAAALHYAHERQIIHRDVKAENMLLGRNDRVLLSDFGIALISSASITQGSQLVAGSVAYMAPEQIMGKPQPASDQYALGVAAYEWLTGEQLFQGTFSELCAQHLYAPPPPLQEKNPTVSSAVEDIIMKALAKDPARRFASVQEFANALAQYASGDALAIPLLPDLSTPEQMTDEDDGLLRGELPIDSAALPVQYVGQSAVAGLDTVITRDDLAASSPSVPVAPAALWTAQTMQGDLALMEPAGMDEIDRVPLSSPSWMKGRDQSRPYQVLEKSGEQTRPLIPHEAGESTQLLFPQQEDRSTMQLLPRRVAAETPALAFPALSGGWRQKLSSVELWSDIVRPGKRKTVIVAALLLLLLVSSVAYAVPHIGGKFGQVATSTAIVPPLMAAVTITPRQKAWSKSYVLSAVMGTPHAAQNQIQARWLTVTTAPQSQTVKATGVKVVPGTGVAATGTLTITSTATVPITFNQGMVLTNTVPGTGAQQVMLNAPLMVAAASPAQPQVQASVVAHVVQIGAMGNIAAGRFIATGTAGASPMPNWSLTNLTPFTGGVDAQTTPFVQQNDIDTATQALIQADAPDPLQVLKPQLTATDRLVGQGFCSPNKSADHQANAQAAAVTVTVSFTCVGDLYNRDRAAMLATDLLREDMKAAHYVSVGTPQIMVTQQTISDNQGTIALQLQAQVTGVYRFDDAALQSLARQIAGKSVSEAENLLEQQEGVGKATITLSGGTSKKSLPARVQDITVSIAA